MVYNKIVNKFPKILKDLMYEHDIDAKTLALNIGISQSAPIYRWLHGKRGILLTSAVSIADYFKCSLDYLFGRSDDYAEKVYSTCPQFDIQFRNILNEMKITQYRLIKDRVVSSGNITSWLKDKQTPTMECIIRIAEYLKISLDYFVGRE